MNALSDYQKAVLAELGIPLWHKRQSLPEELSEIEATTQSEKPAASESKPELSAEPEQEEVEAEHPMAIDVLQHLAPVAGIEIQRWVVSTTLRFDSGVLYAPHPMYLASQPDTKRNLWKLLSG